MNQASKYIVMRLLNLETSLLNDVLMKTMKIVKRSVLAEKKGLTNADINKLQVNYAANIPKYDTVDSMRNAILATYSHARSTDQCRSNCPPAGLETNGLSDRVLHLLEFCGKLTIKKIFHIDSNASSIPPIPLVVVTSTGCYDVFL